jgi:hypothetical protein
LDLPEILAPQDVRVPLELQDPLGLLGLKAQEEILAIEAFKASLGLRDLREILERPDLLELRVPPGLELKEIPAVQDLLVQEV